MKSILTYSSVVKKLKQIDFIEKRQMGSHLIMYHPKADASIVLAVQRSKKEVPPFVIKMIAKLIIEKGILTKDAFDTLFNRSNVADRKK